MASIQVKALNPSDPEISIYARWRVGEFAEVLGTSIEEEEQALKALAADQSRQVALVAICDGRPAGTCLLVTSEIDPAHNVSPWLAGLYVATEFRHLGVGRTLAQEIEEQARLRGVSNIYLYTDDSESSYYRKWVGKSWIASIGKGYPPI